MKPFIRLTIVGLTLLGIALLPGHGQNPAKVLPKLEPIAETKLLMEGLAHPNFRGIERHLTPKPADDKAWIFARGQALLIAETANLLMLRPPRNQGEAVWFDRTMELRTKAVQLAMELTRKDLDRSKASLQNVANSCNRCHQSFRVAVEIVPFQQPDVPPLRKVVHTRDDDT